MIPDDLVYTSNGDLKSCCNAFQRFATLVSVHDCLIAFGQRSVRRPGIIGHRRFSGKYSSGLKAAPTPVQASSRSWVFVPSFQVARREADR